MKKAIIVGHSGQDGTLLYEQLNNEEYAIVGLSSKSVQSNFPFCLTTVNITNGGEVEKLIAEFLPDEIYFFAAVHRSSAEAASDDRYLLRDSMQVNVVALSNFLAAVKKYAWRSRLFYAASSHVFGNTDTVIQDENTPFNPICIYGITKAAGIGLCRFYNEDYGIFASTGIFYNHESPLRASQFVSQKIVEGAVKIKLGLQKKLLLGKLDSRIDWGYAPDYVRAARLVLKLDKPGTFVISSGETHSVADFASTAFSCLGLDWKEYVAEDKTLIAKKSKPVLRGNNAKLRKTTGWDPEVDFAGMIDIMVKAELQKHAG